MTTSSIKAQKHQLESLYNKGVFSTDEYLRRNDYLNHQLRKAKKLNA